MSTITDARTQAAGVLADVFPDLPVYSYPPNNVSAPCAFIALGGGWEQRGVGRWDARLQVTLVAPGGDNEAAVAWLEAAILDAADGISKAMSCPVTWDMPGQTQIAAQTYLAARLFVPISIEI